MDEPVSVSTHEPVYAPNWQQDWAALVAETVSVLRTGQVQLLTHYWQLGALFNRFLAGLQVDAYGPQSAKTFVEALREHGQEVTVANLHQAKRIADRYAADEIPGLVAKGLTVSHLKALLPMADGMREQVEARIVQADGNVCSTRALQQVIRATRAEAMRANFADAAAGMDDDGPALAAEDESMARPAAYAATVGGEAVEVLPPGEARTAGPVPARRATWAPDYSEAPLPALKAAVGAAEKLADKLPSLWTVLGEIGKVGFDSDRARDNAREQAQLLLSAMEALAQIAPEAVKRLRTVIADLDG